MRSWANELFQQLLAGFGAVIRNATACGGPFQKATAPRKESAAVSGLRFPVRQITEVNECAHYETVIKKPLNLAYAVPPTAPSWRLAASLMVVIESVGGARNLVENFHKVAQSTLVLQFRLVIAFA